MRGSLTGEKKEELSGRIVPHGKQGQLSLSGWSPGPSLGFCSLRSKLLTAWYQTELCSALRAEEIK